MQDRRGTEFTMATEIRVWGEGRKDLWSYDETVDIPDDFEEVSLGDAFVTSGIKALAETVYIRMSPQPGGLPSKPVSVLAPREVVQAARGKAERTEPARAAKREKAALVRARKEQEQRDKALAALHANFPGIPSGHAEQVVAHAFKVASGRVGRSNELSLDETIERAVWAHIRHSRTKYGQLLRAGVPQHEARATVRDKIERIYQAWRQPPAGSSHDDLTAGRPHDE
jgi:hypothetical protein